MRFGSNTRVAARSRQSENGMIRIVEGVNDVMGRSRMIGVLLINVQSDGSRTRLQAIAFVVESD